MTSLKKYNDKIIALNSDCDLFQKKQDEYRKIIKEILMLTPNKIKYEEYKDLCNKQKYFIKRGDLCRPASRLSLVQSSMIYILDMMGIIWKKISIEQDELDKIAMKYGFNIAESKGFRPVDPIEERENLIKLFTNFILLQDEITETDDTSTINNVNNACEIINEIMSIYLSEELTVKLLKDWQKAQEIIFPFDEDYRDHLLHQFYVFLLGCGILDRLQDRIIGNWLLYDLRESEEIKARTFRAWLSASLFHDIGYIAGKIKAIGEDTYEKFFSNLNGISYQPFELKLNFNDEMLSKYLIFMNKVLSENESNYYRAKPQEDKYATIKKSLENMDHGALSSYLFWSSILQDIGSIALKPFESMKVQMILRFASPMPLSLSFTKEIQDHIREAQEIDQERHEKYKLEIEEDIDVASYAIAVHNLIKYPTINFFTHPITFLLVLCDELQQWGRVSYKSGKLLSPLNEFVFCKVYLKDEDGDALKESIKDVANLDQYNRMISKNKLFTYTVDNFIEELSSDIIIIKFSDIEDKFIKVSVEKLSQLFNNRLKNGPSLVVTNCLLSVENIVFIAKLENNKYKTFHI